MSESRKEQKRANFRKSEANFLRFLRTTERAQNYNTLKIIGKGAFGEVKLVQRRHDGKIYALKSLIKQEMVSLCVFLYFSLHFVSRAGRKAGESGGNHSVIVMFCVLTCPA